MSVSRLVPRASVVSRLLLLTVLAVAPGCGGDSAAGGDGSDEVHGTVRVANFTADHMDRVTLSYVGGQISASGIGIGGTATFTYIPYGPVSATGYISVSGTGDTPVAQTSGMLDSPTLGLSFE
jgi:hypothetical protein